MTRFICTREGVIVPAGSLDAASFTRLKKQLTVSSRGFKDRIMTMQAMHTNTKKRYVAVARMRGGEILRKMGHEVVCTIPEGDELSADITGASLVLKDYQEPIYRFLSETVYGDDSYRSGATSCILDLQPGKGKTFIAMAIMQYIHKKTLFIVPGRDLLNQTTQTLRNMFPMITVGEYHADIQTDGDVVVMTIDSAAAGEEYCYRTASGERVRLTAQAYFDRFGLTVFDEIHKYCTRQRSSVFTRCQSLFTLGISGTCFHRPDKMDPIAHYHIGVPVSGADLMKPVLEAHPAGVVTPWKFRAVVLKYNGPARYTESITSAAGTVSHPLMVNQFSADPYRSQLLINTVRGLVSDGDRVFIMLDRTELVRLVYDYLRTVLRDDVLREAGMVTGKVKDAERTAARDSRVVIGTYSCIGTGISWDEFNSVVFWHPRRSNFEQFVNRIFREDGDRSVERRAYYLQDNATSIKTQVSGFRSVCIAQRGVSPEPLLWDWQDIEPTPEVLEISRKFEEWLQRKKDEKAA